MAALLNRPHWDGFGSTHKVATGESGVADAQMDQIFGPATNVLLDWAQNPNVPHDQQTLQSAYRDSTVYLTSILHSNFEELDGWWFQFAPRMEATAMSTYWTTITVDKVMLEPAPEGTAPKLVGYKSEQHRAVLGRFSLGAREFHDNLLTPEGRQIWQLKLAAIVSAAAIAAKVCIHNALNRQLFYYKEHQRKNGVKAGSILDALENENNMWGALSFDEKGIYKLDSIIRTMTKDIAVNYNMVVLPHDTLNFLAYSQNYETEVNRRGEGPVQKVLSLGARAMTGIIPGATIYEDKIWKLQNFSMEQLDLFKRLNIQGYFFMLDGTNGGKDDVGKYDPIKALSAQHRNMIPDEYTTFGPKEAIEGSLRFDHEGKLSHVHKALLQNLSGAIAKSGTKAPPNGLIDPYFWKSPGASKGGVGNSGYHILELWGDQHIAYRSTELDMLHGEHFRARALATDFSQEDDSASRRLDELMDMLNNVSEVHESIQALLFAVTTAPENRDDKATFEQFKANHLKRNHLGGVSVPFVDKDPTQTNWEFDGTKVLHPEQQASNFKGKGVIYVKGQNGEKLYVWKLTVDSSEYYTFGASPQFFDKNGDSLNLIPGIGATKFDDTVSAVDGTAIYKNLPGPMPNVSTTGTHAYVLAPFSQFGPVARDGKAYQWNHSIPDTSLYRSKEWKVLKGNVNKTLDQLKGSPNQVAGFLPPQLVEAPRLPYGFGSLAGANSLAQLFVDGDMRGWGEDVCKVAYNGMEAKKRLWSIEKRIHPDNVLHDSTRVPEYMRSDDEDRDAMYATFSGQYESQVRYPVWFRTPQAVTGPLGAKVLMTYLDPTTQKMGKTARTVDDALADAILGDMGITASGGGVVRIRSGGRNHDSTTLYATLRDKFIGILSNANLTPAILSAMKDTDERKALFEAYKGDGAFKSDLGSSYAKNKERVAPTDFEKKEFAWLFFLDVFTEADEDKATALFAGVMGMALVAKKGISTIQRLSGEKIAQMKSGSRATPKKKGGLAEAPHARDADGVLAFAYVNTNLTLSNAYWKTGYSRFSADKDNHARYISYLRNPVRPTNPASPNEPLAPRIFNTNFEGAPAADVQNDLGNFQYARGPMDSRGLTGFNFALPPHPLNAAPEAMDLDGFSPLDAQPQRAHPDVLYAGSMSPFYVHGEGVGATPVYKTYLEQRYRAVVDARADPLVRFGALGLLFSKVTKQSMFACLNEKVLPPSLSYVCAQPFVRIYTQACFWAEGGAQTARLLYKWSDLQFQFQAVTKKWMVHYTGWMDCLVSQPSKIAYIADAKCAGYVSGMDDNVNMKPPLQSTKLNFRDSLFIFDCGSSYSREYARKTANPMSLFGKFNQSMFSYSFTDEVQSSFLNPYAPYPSFFFYDFLWNFTGINQLTSFKNATFKQMKSGRPHYPGLMHMAKHLTWNQTTQDYTKIQSGSGPLKNYDPPLKPVLNGKVLFRGTAFNQ